MELSNNLKYTFEFLRKHQNSDLVENLSDFHSFIDLLIHLNETLAKQNVKVREWEYFQETLILKFALHGISLHQILSGTTFSSQYYQIPNSEGLPILDISSAKTILRAQYETFLIFHHIYVNPPDDDEAELRYYAWIYSALLGRQKYPTINEESKIQKEADRKRMEEIKVKLETLNSFKKLTDKQKVGLINRGTGKLFNNWSKIMDESGFPEGNFLNSIYEYLSIYAHTEGLSILQLKATKFNPKDDHNLSQINSDVMYSKILTCVMIQELVAKFNELKLVWEALPESTRFEVEFYYKIAKTNAKQGL